MLNDIAKGMPLGQQFHKPRITNAGKDVEKLEHLFTAGGTAEWQLWKMVQCFLKYQHGTT